MNHSLLIFGLLAGTLLQCAAQERITPLVGKGEKVERPLRGEKAVGRADSSQSGTGVGISQDFPGGNIVLERIEGDDVYLHQDLRDTRGDWFYWCFAVTGAQGRELKFHFTRSKAIGVLGPGISRDGGRSWSWLGKTPSMNEFSYQFGPNESEVRFSFGMPYQHADLSRFLETHKGNSNLRVETLGKTKKGTPVELLRLGKSDGTARHKVLVTVRHHACEMMASYVAEGLMAALLERDNTGEWLRNHVECVVVPMVDKDGVELGDQGKNRIPHDHKADYRGASIYPEVAALREFTAKWCEGKPTVDLDLHDPTINGRVIYTHALRIADSQTPAEYATDPAKAGALHFLRTLEGVQSGPLKFRVRDSMDFAARMAARARSKSADVDKELFAGLKGGPTPTPISIGFEIPYALVGEAEVNPRSARDLGRDMARALAEYLKSLP